MEKYSWKDETENVWFCKECRSRSNTSLCARACSNHSLTHIVIDGALYRFMRSRAEVGDLIYAEKKLLVVAKSETYSLDAINIKGVPTIVTLKHKSSSAHKLALSEGPGVSKDDAWKILSEWQYRKEQKITWYGEEYYRFYDRPFTEDYFLNKDGLFSITRYDLDKERYLLTLIEPSAETSMVKGNNGWLYDEELSSAVLLRRVSPNRISATAASSVATVIPDSLRNVINNSSAATATVSYTKSDGTSTVFPMTYANGIQSNNSTTVSNTAAIKPTKMKEKTTMNKIIDTNMNAGKIAAYNEAGRLANIQATKVVSKTLPIMARGYADTPFGRLVIANAAVMGAEHFMPTNAQAKILTQAMLSQAYQEVFQLVDVEGMLDQLVNDTKLNKVLAKMEARDATAKSKSDAE